MSSRARPLTHTHTTHVHNNNNKNNSTFSHYSERERKRERESTISPGRRLSERRSFAIPRSDAPPFTHSTRLSFNTQIEGVKGRCRGWGILRLFFRSLFSFSL